MTRITEIPYHADSAAMFEAIVDRPWSVFLDSGRHGASGGRYDILAAHPMATLSTRGAVTEMRRAGRVALSYADPFDLLRAQLGTEACESADLPFVGGAIGWWGYDLARRIERLPTLARDGERLPEMAVAIYDWAAVIDHQCQRSWLIAQDRDASTRRRWSEIVRCLSTPPPPRPRRPFRLVGPLTSNLSRADYGRAFKRIHHYIRNGDCYQVNLAQRFSAPVRGDAWEAYQRLRRLSPAPYAAYLSNPHARILSTSPERFIALRADRVETRPIKGTRPRGPDPAADLALAQELATSPKDRAENVMIVDLLRNDLGKACRPGSVKVPELFAVESYATVHHLVSTVTGQLNPQEHALGLLRACFPGGSITGAPKIRAMEIIEELEPHRRGVYCGAIGYIGFDGAMDTNIAIRTMVESHGEVRCWAGGGIVSESDEEAEYQETLDKAAAMLKLLEHRNLAEAGGY